MIRKNLFAVSSALLSASLPSIAEAAPNSRDTSAIEELKPVPSNSTVGWVTAGAASTLLGLALWYRGRPFRSFKISHHTDIDIKAINDLEYVCSTLLRFRHSLSDLRPTTETFINLSKGIYKRRDSLRKCGFDSPLLWSFDQADSFNGQHGLFTLLVAEPSRARFVLETIEVYSKKSKGKLNALVEAVTESCVALLEERSDFRFQDKNVSHILAIGSTLQKMAIEVSPSGYILQSSLKIAEREFTDSLFEVDALLARLIKHGSVEVPSVQPFKRLTESANKSAYSSFLVNLAAGRVSAAIDYCEGILVSIHTDLSQNEVPSKYEQDERPSVYEPIEEITSEEEIRLIIISKNSRRYLDGRMSKSLDGSHRQLQVTRETLDKLRELLPSATSCIVRRAPLALSSSGSIDIFKLSRGSIDEKS